MDLLGNSSIESEDINRISPDKPVVKRNAKKDVKSGLPFGWGEDKKKKKEKDRVK